jgi:hypothetical protein
MDRLPPELLMNIADFLPTSSSAALAVASNPIYSKLGSFYFQKINEADWEDMATDMIECSHRFIHEN